jgi:uncharacterized protein (TIGR03437 family)
VTVNGKPAFIYFVSAGQLNVLTPLDQSQGVAQIVVTNNGVSSAPFSATMGSAAPSFLLVGSTKNVLATHSDYSLLGPAELSSPGFAFSPAKPGETISLYAVGFGLPSVPLVNGSSTQAGGLPSLPIIRIGGVSAKVVFAGLTAPGLYQLNVTIPDTIPNGNNSITASYAGLSSPDGDAIAVSR